jgi:hypothetical protein
VYPIVRRVADHAVADWFYRRNGRWLFRAVENDVMNETPRVSEAGTVVMYLSVLRKAVEYSRRLNVDAGCRAAWQRILDGFRLETAGGLYRPWHAAPPGRGTTTWFNNAPYIAEAGPFLDPEILRRTRDAHERRTVCNRVWLNSASASTEIRLGRPERAEQFMVDSLDHGIHGPGYFEEVTPNGISALPPFATAHGAYLTAICEQIVLTDFWKPLVLIGRGMPAGLRARSIRFHGLRARGGLIVSGHSTPRRLEVELFQDGEAQTLDMVLRIPCACGVEFTVSRSGAPVAHTFHGEEITVPIHLASGEQTSLLVAG